MKGSSKKCGIKEKVGMIKLFIIAVLYKSFIFFISGKVIILASILLFLMIVLKSQIIAILFFELVFIWVLYFGYFKLLYKEINEYVLVNRVKGSIHMNMKLAKKQFESKNNFGKLKEMSQGFVAGLLLIPEETERDIFLKRRKKFVLTTHEAIFKVIDKEYNIEEDSYELAKNEKAVSEKLILCKIRDIFVCKKYRLLAKKRKGYKVTVTREKLQEVLSEIDQ